MDPIAIIENSEALQGDFNYHRLFTITPVSSSKSMFIVSLHSIAENDKYFKEKKIEFKVSSTTLDLLEELFTFYSAPVDTRPLLFGRYKGLCPFEVASKDPQYIVWMYRNIINKITCSESLYRQCLKIIEEDCYESFIGIDNN
jgi:hypothetical protein